MHVIPIIKINIEEVSILDGILILYNVNIVMKIKVETYAKHKHNKQRKR